MLNYIKFNKLTMLNLICILYIGYIYHNGLLIYVIIMLNYIKLITFRYYNLIQIW